MHENFPKAVFRIENTAPGCGLSGANVGPLTAGTPPTKELPIFRFFNWTKK